MRSIIGRLLLVVLITSVSPGLIRASEKYYVVVFGSEGEPNLARYSHTFATFVKVQDPAEVGVEQALESHTISWLPATLSVAPMRLRPERGVNLDLTGTLQWAASLNSRIVAWGPFEIEKSLYDRALQQEARLKNGEIGYKMIDGRYRSGGASNCIHAVCDIADRETLLTGTAWGESASQSVVDHFRPWLIDSNVTHDLLIDRLGLRDYAITFNRPQ